jgi:hypothetical protein
LEKENQERRAKEDLLRELAIKMGLPVTLVPSSTTSTTTTTTTTTTESTQNDVMVMGHLFNQTRLTSYLFNLCYNAIQITKKVGVRTKTELYVLFYLFLV